MALTAGPADHSPVCHPTSGGIAFVRDEDAPHSTILFLERGESRLLSRGRHPSFSPDGDLNKVIETVLEDLESRLKESEGVVNKNNLPTIEADPVQMYQLFLNLIGNALKFYREGVPPVVNLDSAKMEDGFWEISVEDNGIGIEEEHVDKIFKPFERLHGSSTYEGTGIGLTICNKIAFRHGGKISVKTQSTSGVTFHIILPEKQNSAKMILSKPSGS